MIRIALASSDGIMVNQHFGRCGRFTILDYDTEKKTYEVIGLREMAPVCQPGGHIYESMKQLVTELADCQYVLAGRIGLAAEEELIKKGITAVETTGFIVDCIKQIVRGAVKNG